ncbi:GerAB/ArcD/ProY family transporter [Carboxydothermus pertinax]|uniref:Uncharacterized protein n=1 Tax=Carboxydothermus pertinax TaxID=870242 RepID=A0A1L8CTR4_9THEO|nr:endospore germination permease [Carboxydothermus pertinax]GAV22325.1 hypothetical protein cpu_08350 [Carboxydothermus pertinax]
MKISWGEGVVLIIGVSIGSGIISLPAVMADAAKSSGWWLILPGGLISLLSLLAIVWVQNYWPNQDFIEYGDKLYGKFLSRLFAVIFVYYFLWLGSLVIRVFADFTADTLLEETPVYVLILFFLTGIFYFCNTGFDTVKNVNLIFMLIKISLLLIIVFFVMNKWDLENLRPFVSPEINVVKSILGSVFSFSGYGIFLYLAKGFKGLKDGIKASVLGMGAVTITYMSVCLVGLLIFGPTNIARMRYPTYEIIKMMNLGNVVYRLDSLLIAGWMTAIFTVVGLCVFTSLLVLQKAFEQKDYRHLTAPVLLLLFFWALSPQNIAEVKDNLGTMSVMALFVENLFPFLLLVLTLIKKKRAG